MKYITRVIGVVRGSFYGPERYARIAKETAGKGIKYAFFAALLGALPFIVLAVVGMGALFTIDTSKEAIERMYPGDLEVVLKDGMVSTNVEEPFYLRTDEIFDEETTEGTSGEDEPEYLLVIDTTRELTMDDVTAYDSVAVLGQKTLFFQKEDNEMRSYDLSESEDLTINKDTIVSFVSMARPFLYVGFVFVIILMAALVVLFAAIYFLALAVGAALVVKLIAKLKGTSITYGGAYALSTFVFIATAFTSIGLSFITTGSNFWLLLVLFCLLCAVNIQSETTAVSESVPETPQA